MSQLFISGGGIIGALFSPRVLPVNIQSRYPLELTLLILQSNEGSKVFSSTRIRKHLFFGAQSSLWTNFHICTSIGKTTALTIWTFGGKEISLLFKKLPRFVLLSRRSKCLIISWPQPPSAMIWELKICHCFLLFAVK